jgi:hypothetical protein
MTTATTTMEDIVDGFSLAVDKVESFTIPFLNKPLITDKTVKAYRQEAFILGIIGIALTAIGGFEFTFHNLLGFIIPSTGVHWTTLTLMAFEFAFVSYAIERKGITRLRNIVYSFILAWGFANVTFEWIYVPLYEIIHLKAFYITLPFIYSRPLGAYWVDARNFFWLIMGLVMLFVVCKSSNVKIVPKKIWIVPLGLTALLWIVWVFYPFGFQQVQGNLFPQTLYMIPATSDPNGEYLPLYVDNFGVHAMNLLAKVFQFISVGVVFASLKPNNLIRKAVETYSVPDG